LKQLSVSTGAGQVRLWGKIQGTKRDYYIAELYGKLKKGHIKFPYGDWEKIGWLINHICSEDRDYAEIVKKMTDGGDAAKKADAEPAHHGFISGLLGRFFR
jgi:hypothetical protein